MQITTKKVITVIVTIGAIGGAITTLQMIGDSNWRPAIKKEVEDVRSSADLQIRDLRKEQLELRSEQIESDRRWRQRDLMQQELEIHQYEKQGEAPPEFLLKHKLETERALEQLEAEKRRIQEQMIQAE